MTRHPAWGSPSCPEPYICDDAELERAYVGELADGTPLYVPLNLAEEIDRMILPIARSCCGGVRYHADECPEGPTVDEVLAMSHDVEPDGDDLRADYELDMWIDERDWDRWAS